MEHNYFKIVKRQFSKNLNQREFYFLHSFHCVHDDEELIISTAFYGEDFCSCIKKGNIIGCQFHPEKSHDAGLDIFSEFIKI